MDELARVIHREIEKEGAIQFARFMQLALYHPQFGYYEQGEFVVGRDGDFYTNTSVGSFFGELLALRLAHWLDALEDNSTPQPRGEERSLHILEAGAHQAHLACDVLQGLHRFRPDLLSRVEYWILEPSPKRQSWQQSVIEAARLRVRWIDNWDAVPKGGIHGVIISNELLDSMPVHRVGWNAQKQGWFEWGVTWKNSHFEWAPLPGDIPPAVSKAMPHLPYELLKVLPDGFTTEIGLAGAAWWRAAARNLRCGKLMTIDYGLSAEEFFLPHRAGGTLRGYEHHHAFEALLTNSGCRDMTACVNFSVIQAVGEAAGLKTESLISQREFLTEIAQRYVEKHPPFSPKQHRQFQTLTHPEHLGRSFRVLVQSR